MRPFKTAAAAMLLMSGVLAGPNDDLDTLSHMIDKTNQLRTHSLAPPYVDSDLQNRWWDFGGDAIINTNKHVRLTQDKPSQKGWLWSRMPLSVLNWQVEVEFRVDGKANNLFGDGFAIWLSKDRAKLGSVFGSIGQYYFNGLGIFFDTYANSRHSYTLPRVTVMQGDGKKSYDHSHDNAEHELAACSENFRRKDFPTKARLTYLKNKFLQLKLQTRKPDEWITCFEVEVSLPDSPYLGFSAETGDVHDNHDIVSVNTNSLSLKPEYRGSGGYQAAVAQGHQDAATGKTAKKGANTKQAPFVNTAGAKVKRDKSKKSGGVGSIFLLLLKGIAILAFIAFCAAAYRTYNAEQRSRRTW